MRQSITALPGLLMTPKSHIPPHHRFVLVHVSPKEEADWYYAIFHSVWVWVWEMHDWPQGRIWLSWNPLRFVQPCQPCVRSTTLPIIADSQYFLISPTNDGMMMRTIILPWWPQWPGLGPVNHSIQLTRDPHICMSTRREGLQIRDTYRFPASKL